MQDIEQRRKIMILELAADGRTSPRRIAEMVDLAGLGPCTRNAVIGMMHRNGIGRDITSAERTEHARRGAEAARQVIMPRKPGFQPLTLTAQPQPSHKPGCIDPSRFDRPAPPTAVPLDDRKGCRWPYGDPKEGLLYCNAPQCRISYNGRTRVHSYCAEHYEASRSSAYAKIIA